MPTELQVAATDYIAAGLHILALTGKKPNFRVHGESWTWDDSFHGEAASLAEVDAVWDAFSQRKGTTGIAILIPPDFYVADVDTDRAAELILALGWQRSDDSVVSLTKNGVHIWFCMPGADRNRWVGDGQEPDPTRTLLFKGLGGYVVAPPSLHFADDGTVDGTYEWAFSIVLPSGGIAMPDLLPEGVRRKFILNDQLTGLKTEKDAMTSFSMTPVEGVPWYEWPKVWDYQTAGLERAIESAADGNQNNLIHWAALTCREEGVPYEVAMERLLAAAIKGGHPRARARDTIKGAYKRAARG